MIRCFNNATLCNALTVKKVNEHFKDVEIQKEYEDCTSEVFTLVDIMRDQYCHGVIDGIVNLGLIVGAYFVGYVVTVKAYDLIIKLKVKRKRGA